MVDAMNVGLPDGLVDVLKTFTVVVIKEKPTDIVAFAADYFSKLKNSQFKPGGVSRGAVSFNADSDDVNTDGDSDDEPMLEPPAKMRNAKRRQSVCAEPYHPDSDDSDADDTVIYPKTDEQRSRLNEAVKDILLFKNLDIDQLHQVLDAMFERKVSIDEHVIDQDDDGDNFYVIDNGTFDIYVKMDGENQKVGQYKNSGSFGELALMYNTPRAATIVATSEGVVWALDRVTFRKILLKAAAKKRKMHEMLLESVSLLDSLQPYERMNLADALETRTFSDGQRIIKQGDEGDRMYFIERGQVSVRMTSGDDPEKDLEVTQLKQGEFFGELALVTHKPRAASVYATGDVAVAELPVLAFERLLGSCYDIMKRRAATYDEQLKQLGITNKDLR